MQKVRIFKSIESELGILEKEINQWIADEKVHVISMTGNIAPQTSSGPHLGAFGDSDVIIILLYEERKS